MGCHPYYFIFKNVLFFIYCTEQNTKEIIWLKRCYLPIKTRRSILKWYGSTKYLWQPISNNNRLTKQPPTIVNPTTIHFFWYINRSSRLEVLCQKGVLRNFAKCTGKHRARVSFLIKLQASEHLLWLLLYYMITRKLVFYPQPR